MNEQYLIYRHTVMIIDSAIAVNLLLRNTKQAKDYRDAWGSLQYAKEMATVKVSLGRNTGKTTYIHNNMTKNDLAFFINRIPLQEYPDRENYFVAADVETRLLRRQFRNPKFVYVDEPKVFFSHVDMYDFYCRILSMCDEVPTFVFLGN